MATPQTTVSTARTIRLIHAAMVVGVLLFAAVVHFALRPSFATGEPFSPVVIRVLLGLALAACALSLVLRGRIPQRGSDESPDLFWTRAAQPALLTWAPLEAACLISILAYLWSGSQSALGVAALAVILFVARSPAYLERG